MRKVKIVFLFLFILFLLIFIIANKETTRSIGINYKLTEYKIPIYLKIFDFYHRHYNYKFLVKTINNNINIEEDIVLNTAKWINDNIKKIPKDVDVVDNHPLTIIERRLGTDDQFSDLLSVLLVYSGIDSFYISKFNNRWHPLTFFKINDYWTIIDPYYGIFFTNNEQLFTTIENLKNEEWNISDLEFKNIDNTNFKKIFGKKFNNYSEIKNYYIEIFNYLPSNKKIENTNLFEWGSRSYKQKPYGRIKYEIYKMLKN